MTKRNISGLWIIGFFLAIFGGLLYLIGLATSGLAGKQSGLETVGYLMASAGVLLTLIAWIMALLMTARMKRWGWFAALLLLGLVGLEFFVMIAYLIAGPGRGGMGQFATPVGPPPDQP